MTLAEKITQKALTLPDGDRAALVDALLRSFHETRNDVDELWAREAERGVQEIEDGSVELLDGEQVLREARERLRR